MNTLTKGKVSKSLSHRLRAGAALTLLWASLSGPMVGLVRAADPSATTPSTDQSSSDTPPPSDTASTPQFPSFTPPTITPPTPPTFTPPTFPAPQLPSTDNPDSDGPPSDSPGQFPPTITPPVFTPPDITLPPPPTIPDFPTVPSPEFPTPEFPAPSTPDGPPSSPPSTIFPSTQNPNPNPPAQTPVTPTVQPVASTTQIPTSQPTPAPTPVLTSPAVPTPQPIAPPPAPPTAQPAPVLAFAPPVTAQIPEASVVPPAVAVNVQPLLPSAPTASNRSAFVRSIPDPSQLPRSLQQLVRNLLLAVFLVLLLVFPAELFNSTLASNYDEVSGWFKFKSFQGIYDNLRRLPAWFSVGIYAAAGALLNSQLSPDFGLNKASLALFLGMFLTLLSAAIIYDLSRAWYLKRRFGFASKLRIHALGLIVGVVFVVASRLAHFLPGYFYGLFTALVFGGNPADEQDGEGLAIASIWLLAIAAAGWFIWIPVKHSASLVGASFGTLVLDALLSSLWVSALGAVVFGLAPLRFFYGEQVKKWSSSAWVLIYGTGMLLFVYTLIHPGQSFYGSSDKTSLTAVLTLFILFGLFSLSFWAYFRWRPARN